MNDSLLLAIVAGSSAVLGSLVTGWITYITSVKQREADGHKRRLKQCYKDIAAFYRLEESYTKALETSSHGKSAESWKREIRKNLRDSGFASPSDSATAQKAEQKNSELI